jgi:hypothetical protein
MSAATRELRTEQTFHIGQLSTPVLLRVYRLSNGGYQVEASHYLKTAIQYLAHTASPVYTCEESEALKQYQATVLGFYEQAVRRGYPPSESWLIPNPNFENKL